jgi:hypothetical protein
MSLGKRRKDQYVFGGIFQQLRRILEAVSQLVGDPVTLRFWIGGLLILGSVVTLNRMQAFEGKNKSEIRTT